VQLNENIKLIKLKQKNINFFKLLEDREKNVIFLKNEISHSTLYGL
jgi:hypothetical protein